MSLPRFYRLKRSKGPSLLPALENCSAEEAETEQRILEGINALRLIHPEYSGLHSMEEESLGGAGYSIRLECGRLGLMQGKAVNYA